MIPFGSQRGSGGDLAIHLSNTEENEYVELAELRGAVADDLHGAFSEWEAQAHAMTKAEKYLYSLSINPDPAQGRFSREQYDDYIARVEENLGLAGQPRATVFHIKAMEDGELREHCHVVWSRIDAQECKAIHISYDQRKLMAITREFAHDHGLELPEGYHSDRAKHQQLSLYEKAHLDRTGLGRAQRQDLITTAWKAADCAESFVAALEDNGYILAQGRRPYLVVDTHGHVSALPRLIDDRTVRSKDVETFLKDRFPSDKLPTVEQAQARQADYLTQLKALHKTERSAEARSAMQARQDERRAELVAEFEAAKGRHKRELNNLNRTRAQSEEALFLAQAQEDLRVRRARDAKAPKGLAGLFSKVTGISFLRSKFYARQDRIRAADFERRQNELSQYQVMERSELTLKQQNEMLEFSRRTRNLEQIFQRERRSLETSESQKENLRVHLLAQTRRRKEMEPAVPGLTLTPRGRVSNAASAIRRTIRPSNSQMKPSGPKKKMALEPSSLKIRDAFNEQAKKRANPVRATLDFEGSEGKLRFPVKHDQDHQNDDDHEPEI
jgi:hypothetical protein